MTDTIQDRLRGEADDFDWPVSSDTAHAAATHIDAQDAKIKALVEATDYARNRLEMMAGDACNIDGRDLKRNLQGVFAEYDAALAAAKETT